MVLSYSLHIVNLKLDIHVTDELITGHFDLLDIQEEIEQVIEEVKVKHPALDVNKEDIIEKGWTKRQHQATNQYVRKMEAVSSVDKNHFK